MSHFEQAFQRTVGLERGYSNHPNDPGGETMFGITVAVARYHGYSAPMRDLPLEEARRIYRIEYWDPLKLDQVAELSHLVAEELFDSNVNLWRGAAAKFLQQALASLGATLATGGPIPVDGIIGSGTIGALQGYLEGRFSGKRNPAGDRVAVLLRTLNSLQCADYVRQVGANPGKRDFFFGWVLKRVVI